MGNQDHTVYRLGTRASALALAQSKQVQKALLDQGVHSELVEISSTGDQNLKDPLYAMEGQTPGLFTKQLEQAQLSGHVDFAVHSYKDVPTQSPKGLIIAALLARENAHDALLISAYRIDSKQNFKLSIGAKVGTSSLRREAQLLSQRSDLNVVPIRGNVPSRVRAVQEGQFDAVVLAQAGLNRLGLALEGILKIELDESHFVPAPAQGVIAVQARESAPAPLLQGLKAIHDSRAELETRIERDVMRELEGGCSLPLGVRVVAEGELLKLRAFLAINNPASASNKWKGFHHFAIEGQESQIVDKTVSYFKSIRDA